jgi:hypothetical protein
LEACSTRRIGVIGAAEWNRVGEALRACPDCFARLVRRLSARASVARRAGLARRSLYDARLRAYDTNRLGFARLRDALARR